jgi:anti-anti-sigma factor
MSSDSESVDAEMLRIETKDDGREVTIILAGELETDSVELFLACVREAFEARRRPIAVDARGVTFMDSSGLAALLHACSMSRHAGLPFRVSEASPNVGRLLEVSGVEELLMDIPPASPDAEPPPDP